MDKISEVEYFGSDELAASVWRGKYAMEGEVNPDDMHLRMAKEFARIEEKYITTIEDGTPKTWEKLSVYGSKRKELTEDKIYILFKDFKYIVPQGSIMSMLGSNKIGSLSNCFVIGQPEDSYGGIMQKDQQLVQLMKRRGGVGLDISTLRPSGTTVTNAAKTSTGAVSFMERFSNSTREVAQGGRRGALMLTIDCRHPDVFDFVNVKKDRTKVTGANISVMLRDDFMQAVKNDADYILRFPCDKDIITKCENFEYNKLYEFGEGQIKKIKAKELYDSIVENAWENAEPGQMFVDRHHSYSPDSVYPQYKGVTTNPCGEIFMQEYDACRLLALNLFSIVKDPFTNKAEIDYDLLYEIAYEQQRLADDIVDLELEHITRILVKIKSDVTAEDTKQVEIDLWEKVYDVASKGRRTGCGFTALGDMLAALNLGYDSDKGLEAIEAVMQTKMKAELDCTIDLAILRGPFDGWDVDKEFNWQIELINKIEAYRDVSGKNNFYQMLVNLFPEQVLRMSNHGRRNISFSTVAPTGSVSILTQTSSGLEPLFMPYYMRRKKVNPNDVGVRVDFTDQNGDTWQEFPVLHPKFKAWINTNFDKLGLSGQEDIEIEISKENLQKAFELSPWYGSTANDIDWSKRVEIQAAIQKYTSHSISSTINLPENVTKEEVSKIYMHAYDSGLKGVTIYRDNCRSGVLVNMDNKKSDKFEYHDAPKRPEILPIDIHATTSKGVKWNVIVGLFDNKPYEVFAVPYFTNETSLHLQKKKKRYDILKNNETYSEDITAGMTDEQEVITRLCSTSLRHGSDITFLVEQLEKTSGDITSFSKALSRVLKRYARTERLIEKQKCQECKSTNLHYEEACLKCLDCGNSKCG